MENSYNTQYSATISIGSRDQELRIIPDTGSFELVIPSILCNTTSCLVHQRFDPYASSSFKPKPIDTSSKVEINYGQGGTVCVVGYDDVTIDSLTAPKQILKLMYDETIRGFAGAQFDGIMGMGKNPDAELGGLAGMLGASSPALLTNMGQGAVGVCLGQGDGDNGRLDLAEDLTKLPSLYTSHTKVLTSIGEYHWGLRLSGLGVTDASNASNLLWLEGDEMYGCSEERIASGECKVGDACDSEPNCAAVIDTGTSLMLLADDHYYALLTLIDETAPGKLDELYEQNDCSAAADALPSVVLKLGEEGETLEIKPEVYMAVMPIPLGISLREWRSTKKEQEGSQVSEAAKATAGFFTDRCVDLFSTIDARIVTEHNGLMYILGMPLFRQFAVAFDRDADPHTISFSEVSSSHACASCDGKESSIRANAKPPTALAPPRGVESESTNTSRVGVRVEPSKLRYPTHGYHGNKGAGPVRF